MDTLIAILCSRYTIGAAAVALFAAPVVEWAGLQLDTVAATLRLVNLH